MVLSFGTESEPCGEHWPHDAQTPKLKIFSLGDFGGWKSDIKMKCVQAGQIRRSISYYSSHHRIPRNQKKKNQSLSNHLINTPVFSYTSLSGQV